MQLLHQLEALMVHTGRSKDKAAAILEGRPVSDDKRDLFLLVADPVGIKDTVLGSRRAKTRYGASTTLYRWDEDLRERRRTRAGSPLATAYAGGGQATVIGAGDLAAAKAEAAELRERYKRELHGVLGVVVQAVSPKELATGPAVEDHKELGLAQRSGGFAGLLSQVGARLRAEKDKGEPLPDAPARDGRSRCKECGWRERVHKDRCATCEDFHGQADARDLDSFEDLGSTKLAYLAIDGTGIGARLLKQESIADYHQFSRGLLSAFDFAAVEADLARADIDACIPVLRGGDDLLLVFDATAGKGAFLACDAVLNGLHDRLAGLSIDAQPIGVGMGLVVSRHVGARQAFALAEQLVKTAKAKAKKKGWRSAFDFELVQQGTVLHDDMLEARKDAAKRTLSLPGGTNAHIYKSARPLSPEDMQAMAQALRDHVGTPGVERAARELARMVEDDEVIPALIHAGYLRTRREDGDALGSLLNLGQDPLPTLHDHESRLLRRLSGKQAEYESLLSDMLDMHRATRAS